MISWLITTVNETERTGFLSRSYTYSDFTTGNSGRGTTRRITAADTFQFTENWSIRIYNRTTSNKTEGTEIYSVWGNSQNQTRDLGAEYVDSNDTTITTHILTRRIETSTVQTSTARVRTVLDTTVTLTRYLSHTTTKYPWYTEDTNKIFLTPLSDTVTSLSYSISFSDGTSTRDWTTTLNQTELNPQSFATVYQATAGAVLWYIETYDELPYDGDITAASDVAESATRITAKPWSKTRVQSLTSHDSYTYSNIWAFGGVVTASTRTSITQTSEANTTEELEYDALSYEIVTRTAIVDAYRLPMDTTTYEHGRATLEPTSINEWQYPSQSVVGNEISTISFYIENITTYSGFTMNDVETFSSRFYKRHTRTTQRLLARFNDWGGSLNLSGGTNVGNAANGFTSSGITQATIMQTGPQNLKVVAAFPYAYPQGVENTVAVPVGVIADANNPPALAGYYTASPPFPLSFVEPYTAFYARANYDAMTHVWPRVPRKCYLNATDENAYESEATAIFEGPQATLFYTSEATSTVSGETYTYVSETSTTFTVGAVGESHLGQVWNARRFGGHHPYGTQLIVLQRGVFEEISGTNKQTITVNAQSIYTTETPEGNRSGPSVFRKALSYVDIDPAPWWFQMAGPTPVVWSTRNDDSTIATGVVYY